MDQDQLLQVIKSNEKKAKNRSLFVILLLLVIALLFVGITTLKVTENKENVTKISKEKDSLQTVNLVYNSNIKKEDSILQKISIFFKMRYIHDSATMSHLFEDTIQRYYMQENCSLSKVLSNAETFWKQNPKDSFEFDKSEIAINFIDSNNSRALIKAKYCINPNSCNEIVEELRFNKKLKIYFVRAYNVME